MKVDKALIDRLSNLSRLHFSESEAEEVAAELGQILSFIEKLKEVDTSNMEPLIHLSNTTNVLRPDEVVMEISHEEALLNAPVADSDYFKVPKVLKKKQGE